MWSWLLKTIHRPNGRNKHGQQNLHIECQLHHGKIRRLRLQITAHPILASPAGSWSTWWRPRLFIPAGFSLIPGTTVKVHSGQGNDTSTDLYNSKQAWGKTDTAILKDASEDRLLISKIFVTLWYDKHGKTTLLVVFMPNFWWEFSPFSAPDTILPVPSSSSVVPELVTFLFCLSSQSTQPHLNQSTQGPDQPPLSPSPSPHRRRSPAPLLGLSP